MQNLNQDDAPSGHLWAEELARTSQSDIETIIWLCKEEYIQGVNISGRWAVRVLKTTSVKTGKAIVRDLKAGRDIAIGSVIGQYISIDDGQKEQKKRDHKERISQEPVRHQIEVARRLIHATWYIVGGGSLLFLVGLIFAIPLSALVAAIAVYFSNKASRLAKQHGSTVLIEDAEHVRSQSIVSASILWGGIVLVAGFFALIASA